MDYHLKMEPFDRLMTVLKELRWKDADFYNAANEAKQNFNGWKKRKSIPKEKMNISAGTIGVRPEWLFNGCIDRQDKSLGIRLEQCLTGRCSIPESASLHTGIPYHHLLNAIKGRNRLSPTEYKILSKELNQEVSYLQRIYTRPDNTPDYFNKEDFKRLPSSSQQAIKLSVASKIQSLVEPISDKILVPIWGNAEISAGPGTIIVNEYATDFMLVEKKWLKEIVHFIPQSMAIVKVRGDSMEPTLASGDMILVDIHPIDRDQLNDGLYTISRNGMTHVKRLQNLEHGIRIISDNKELYPSEIVTDGLIVCGRVIWAWQGKRF